MPSWQARFYNIIVRLYARRRYGNDVDILAKNARRMFGAPGFFQQFHTRGLIVKSVNEAGASGEWIETKNAKKRGAIFYIHGGGYVSCSARTHRPLTATLARKSNLRVFAPEYRLAPEHKFPAALDDVFEAYRWLVEAQKIPASEIAVAGDSAGGGLTVALLLRLRDQKMPPPACAVCFSPWTDLTGAGASLRTNAARDNFFYAENVEEFAAAYLDEKSSAKNVYASPVFGDFHALPPVLFHVGSTEILLDDARRIHEKILAAGGASELEIYEDIFHGWQMLAPVIPESNTSLRRAAEFICRHVSPNDEP